MEKMRQVSVYVGPGLDEDGIEDVLNGDDELGENGNLLFEVAHALLSDHKDDRAQVYAVSVNDVTIDPSHPNQVLIEFRTSWSAYYGCQNMDMADDEYESQFATYTSIGHLIFNVPSPRRPANDC